MNEWKTVAPNTIGMEIPGVGVIVTLLAPDGFAAVATTFVPGARINGDNITREDRNAPPLVGGKKLSDIHVRPDPGAAQYFITDDEDF